MKRAASMRVGPRGGTTALAIQTLNHRHDQLVNWLVLNPHRSLGECAKEFGYTHGSLSRIIHSDMFQAIYRERCQETGSLAVHTITNRLSGVAALALERTEQILSGPKVTERFVGDTLRTTLSALGFGPSNGNGEQKHLHVHLTPQELQDARARVSQKAIEVAKETGE